MLRRADRNALRQPLVAYSSESSPDRVKSVVIRLMPRPDWLRINSPYGTAGNPPVNQICAALQLHRLVGRSGAPSYCGVPTSVVRWLSCRRAVTVRRGGFGPAPGAPLLPVLLLVLFRPRRARFSGQVGARRRLNLTLFA